MPKPRARMRRSAYKPRPRSAVKFRYREQFGVIVICAGENEQRRLYGRLSRAGLRCKVVTT